ncbi:uncharacterized protein LOC123321379 [Coccinella septempunctata]|uniref:uncharacterized protein LOC123321379 n=1 Tax=Coccinella septempunctata TaxID=41139 RepID=UPI001D0988C0|nr:uncharacterized protein LOC123321379 [Coccinella septempunctata]
MADSRPARTSQGTDMMEFLRFPDAIEYDQIVKNCNRLARPIGSRSVTNKCYVLLWKATYFAASVFIGVQHVLDTLEGMKNEPVPCLVMLAADAFIDADMTLIVESCKVRVIPYIFIPNRKAMRDALSVENDVLAVLIAFNHDPGMRREFEDCFVSIRSQCFRSKKKRRRVRGTHPPTSVSVPPEIGPRGEMPQQVTTQVSTRPSGEIISLIHGPESSSDSDWITISTDSDSESEQEKSKDFSVNVPDESGSTFHEYVRIPSPTPAPSPSEMVAHQRPEVPSSTVGGTSTACSSDESVRPGPSREFLTPPMKRRQHTPHKQATWPIALPYAPKEDFDDEKIRMYLQTICRKKKKLRLRTKTSVPPTCTMPQSPLAQKYMHNSSQPSTSGQYTSVPQTTSQEEPIDVDADDISFQWTMDDLSSTSNEQLIDLTSSPINDSDKIHEISSSDDDVLMIEESSNIGNDGAAGDGNICSLNSSTSSSSASTATLDMTTGEEAYSSRYSVHPSEPFLVGDSAANHPTFGMNVESSHGLGDFCIGPSSARSSDTQASTSSSSGDVINLQPSSSTLFAFSDTPSNASLSGESSAAHATPTESVHEMAVPSSSRDLNDGPSRSVDLINAQAGPSSGVGDVPAVPSNSGELGDAAAASSSSRAAGVGDGGGSRRMGMSHPSAFGDVGIGDGYTWPIRSYNRNTRRRIPHRVTGTGEGGPSPFMPTTFSFIFAPRIVYTAAATEDGMRRGAWNVPPGQQGFPTEEDLLDIPFPLDEDSPRSDENSNLQSSRSEDVIASDEEDNESSEESDLSPEEENVEPPSPFEFSE